MYKNQISFKLMKKFSGSSAGEKEDLSKKEDFENNKSSKGNLKKMDNSKFSYEYPIGEKDDLFGVDNKRISKEISIRIKSIMIVVLTSVLSWLANIPPQYYNLSCLTSALRLFLISLILSWLVCGVSNYSMFSYLDKLIEKKKREGERTPFSVRVFWVLLELGFDTFLVSFFLFIIEESFYA